jgi:hypothetical protein
MYFEIGSLVLPASIVMAAPTAVAGRDSPTNTKADKKMMQTKQVLDMLDLLFIFCSSLTIHNNVSNIISQIRRNANQK